jgi:IclR family acetate operon transcriptional repressor
MPRTGRPAARPIGAVERALAVLDALADAAAEVGTNELGRQTGINASTVSRVLATLTAAGYAEYVPSSGRYRLGPRLIRLGAAALGALDLRELARPRLQALAAETGETATLSVPGDHDAVTVDFVQSGSSVQSVARLGRPSVGHATAAGKVLLALGRAAPPAGRLQRFTPRTIASRRALAVELDGVREQGWARALGEREPDLNAIAAPVWDSRGELAAILGLQGPASRFATDETARALGPLLAHAAALSRALGAP